MKFTGYSDNTYVTMEISDPSINEALTAFSNFLRAMGYELDANEEVVLWSHKETINQIEKEWEKED